MQRTWGMSKEKEGGKKEDESSSGKEA